MDPMAPAVSNSDARGVEFGRGAGWIGGGWEMFRLAPGTWIGIIVVYLVLSIVVGLVPGGGLVGFFLNPVFGGGIMLGCASLAAGEGLRFDHLFDGFRGGRLGSLLLLGLLELAFAVLAVLAAVLVLMVAFGMAFLQNPDEAEPVVVLVGVLVVMALILPLAMATWFAPARIVLAGDAPWPAMKASFRGCLKNLMPFLLYGIVGLLLLFVASIPLGLGLLIAVPMLAASIYVAYIDLWPGQAGPQARE